ncbi:hypothetical protein ANANG_G00309210 [Anguilla anguilla]|uniref:Sema domain-containing protein n=1 Tax=Anguilla anguilla TaxID=7936 RepID=A0A9D3RJN2_ANGAN|nr:hypothetical protein ANANG_G00309210 [Anguilla anguilla]
MSLRELRVCQPGERGQYSSSKEYPDEALRFARDHPAMLRPVRPCTAGPSCCGARGPRLTQLAADRVEARDGHYDVLFIGTDDAVVLKVIAIYNKDSDTVEEVLLEELHVFKVPVPITEILISAKRQQLYVGSELGVVQVKLHQCHLYGSACADCCLARDPYCAWDGAACSRYLPAGPSAKRRFRRQDVRHGNAVQQCEGAPANGDQAPEPEERLVIGVENSSVLLECRPRSPQAQVLWFRLRGSDKEEVRAGDRVAKTPHGLLFLGLRRADAGAYLCQSAERGFVRPLARGAGGAGGAAPGPAAPPGARGRGGGGGGPSARPLPLLPPRGSAPSSGTRTSSGWSATATSAGGAVLRAGVVPRPGRKKLKSPLPKWKPPPQKERGRRGDRQRTPRQARTRPAIPTHAPDV